MWPRRFITLILVYVLTMAAGGTATESQAQRNRKLLDYINNSTVIEPSEVEQLKKEAGFSSDSSQTSSSTTTTTTTTTAPGSPKTSSSSYSSPFAPRGSDLRSTAQSYKSHRLSFVNAAKPNERKWVGKEKKSTIKLKPAATRRKVAYRAAGPNWSVVSGYEKGQIFYERTRIRNGKKQIVAFRYSPSERKHYDRIIADLDKGM